MLKGLRGILEKGLQIAAPIIGGSMFGAPGAMFGSGIASLLSGDKAQDALIKAGMSGMAGYRGQGGTGTSIIDKFIPKSFTPSKILSSGVSESMDKLIDSQGMKKASNVGGALIDFLGKKSGKDGTGPSIGGQLLATGLPAVLSYMAALEDAKKAGVDDPSEYMSAVDKLYGGQFAPPPEDRRIKNLSFQGIGGDGQPIYANQGGIMNAQQPVQYSAATGQGIMGMAKGGDVFPRKTGQIEGPGTKTSDSIPAMLSDGEFVQRTDAVNGAGIMMGATNAKEAREKGADFMYALQDKLAKIGQKVA